MSQGRNTGGRTTAEPPGFGKCALAFMTSFAQETSQGIVRVASGLGIDAENGTRLV